MRCRQNLPATGSVPSATTEAILPCDMIARFMKRRVNLAWPESSMLLSFSSSFLRLSKQVRAAKSQRPPSMSDDAITCGFQTGQHPPCAFSICRRILRLNIMLRDVRRLLIKYLSENLAKARWCRAIQGRGANDSHSCQEK